MVLLRRLMLSKWRSAKSIPRMRRMGRSSTASHWMRKRQFWISATPKYWPRTDMPPALPPIKRGPVYGCSLARWSAVREAVLTRQYGEQVSMCTSMGTPSMRKGLTKCGLAMRRSLIGARATEQADGEAGAKVTGRQAAGGVDGDGERTGTAGTAGGDVHSAAWAAAVESAVTVAEAAVSIWSSDAAVAAEGQGSAGEQAAASRAASEEAVQRAPTRCKRRAPSTSSKRCKR